MRPQWLKSLQNTAAKPALTVEIAKAREDKAKAEKAKFQDTAKDIMDTLKE